MSLESLGSFIRQPRKGNGFHRIYRAHILQGKITEMLGSGVTVTLRGSTVRLHCDSEQLAVLVRLKKTRLLALCHKTLGQAELKLTVKVRSR